MSDPDSIQISGPCEKVKETVKLASPKGALHILFVWSVISGVPYHLVDSLCSSAFVVCLANYFIGTTLSVVSIVSIVS